MAGVWHMGAQTGFGGSGKHFWEISSTLLPQPADARYNSASDRPSFAVGLVTSDRMPGKIFLGSEPGCGSLGTVHVLLAVVVWPVGESRSEWTTDGSMSVGYGFAYLGSRAALLSTGSEPRQYGIQFAAGDKVGVLLDLDAREISFFVNDECQGVAFSSDDLTEVRQPLRPAVALSKAGVQVAIRHGSAAEAALRVPCSRDACAGALGQGQSIGEQESGLALEQ